MTGFTRSHHFSHIYIVQFLSSHDTMKTGRDLFDYLQPYASAAEIGLEFLDVRTATDFLSALKVIIEHCRRTGSGPLLHLETHGTVDGICISREEFIPWGSLKEPLTELNRLSQMNLLVTLAACHGFNLVKALRPGDESPVWALFGPTEQVLPSDIRAGFQSFFRILLEELDLNAAIRALKEADRSYPDGWSFQNAEIFFAYIYGSYLDEHIGPETLLEREEGIVRGLCERGVPDTPALRQSIRTMYADEHGIFGVFKRRFLMLDRFPENESRFLITLGDVNRLRQLRRASEPRQRGA